MSIFLLSLLFPIALQTDFSKNIPAHLHPISSSMEHISEGDSAGGPSTGYLKLENHVLDFPEHQLPIARWPRKWQSLYHTGSHEQKRLLTQGLTYGEIMALSGDLYETYEDLAAAPLEEIYELLPLIQSPFVTTIQLQKTTGGRYLSLAESNQSHFTQVPTPYNNISTWETIHRRALLAARKGRTHLAWSLSAVAAHYLTDAFCSGHVRVPRANLMGSSLANIYSKIVHDIDNEEGVLVNNIRGDGPWVAYGDMLLYDRRNAKNRTLLLEAVRLAKLDIEKALFLGDAYPIPDQNTRFPSRDLVPYALVPSKDFPVGEKRYIFSSIGFVRQGLDSLQLAIWIGHLLWSSNYKTYWDKITQMAKTEFSPLIDHLFHEDDYARAWIQRYSSEILRRQPVKQKVRLILILLKDWVSHEDREALRKLITSTPYGPERILLQKRIFSHYQGILQKRERTLLESLFSLRQ